MRRLVALVSAAIAMAGCQSASAPSDPFLRTTVPPPGTAGAANNLPGAIQPPQVFPGGSAAPAVVPGTTPSSPYIPPGGFNSSQLSPRHPKAVAATGSEYRISPTGLARRTPAPTTPPPTAQSGATLSATTPPSADTSRADVSANSTITLAAGSSPSDSLAPRGITRTTAVIAGGQGESTVRIVDSGDAQAAPQGTPAGRITLAVNDGVTELTDLPRRGQSDVRPTSFTTAAFSGGGSAASFVTPTSYNSTATSPPGSSGGRYNHADDYQTLRGRLEYSAGQKRWKLRYIPIDGQTDKFGGSVVLKGAPDVGRFKTGDYVTASGRVTPRDTTGRDFSPQYELAALEPQAN